MMKILLALVASLFLFCKATPAISQEQAPAPTYKNGDFWQFPRGLQAVTRTVKTKFRIFELPLKDIFKRNAFLFTFHDVGITNWI